MQCGNTAYLGMTLVVSGQFLRIQNLWHGATAKHDCEEPKNTIAQLDSALRAHIPRAPMMFDLLCMSTILAGQQNGWGR